MALVLNLAQPSFSINVLPHEMGEKRLEARLDHAGVAADCPRATNRVLQQLLIVPAGDEAFFGNRPSITEINLQLASVLLKEADIVDGVVHAGHPSHAFDKALASLTVVGGP
jgi:hypothetical protein